MSRNNIIIAALLLLCACSKDDSAQPAFSSEVIVFEAGYEDSVSKASGVTVNDVKQDGFLTVGITSSNWCLFRDSVRYDSSVMAFSPVNGPYYYPASGLMTFFAAYPKTADLQVSGHDAVIGYTYDGVSDIMTAYRDSISPAGSAVNLTFRHILSQLHFRINGLDQSMQYRIRSLSVNVPSDGFWSYDTGLWTVSGGTVEAVGVESTVVVPKRYPYDLTGDLLIVPCEPVVTVEWETYSSDGTFIASYRQSKLLGAVTGIGARSVITLNLPNEDAEKLGFNITLQSWENNDVNFDFEAK